MLMREWCRHELDSLRDFVPPDDLKNHTCIFHYQSIQAIMFAHGVEDVPDYISDLSQESIEILLDQYGIKPEEFL